MAYYVQFHHGVPVLPPSHALSRLAHRRPRRLRQPLSWMGQTAQQAYDNSAPPPPPIDPTTGLPTTTAIPMPGPSSYGPTPTTVFNWGYNPAPSIAAGILGPSLSATLLPPSESGESGTGLTIPGSTPEEVAANAMTGTLTTAQVASINANNAAACAAAGGDPTACAQQSAADTNAVLTTEGAAPSQAWWSNPEVWLALGGGVLMLVLVMRR
jgi:hypothetical protein